MLGALLLVCAAACADGSAREDRTPGPALGLFTTLPIYWGEGGDISAIIDGEGQANWVRRTIEADYAIEPLDALESEHLAEIEHLLLAQPRPLAPSENVALDEWVRAGGQLLLFADPMLTQDSAFALGDPRRPHDVIMLSPILAHWGLELTFDAGQQPGERRVSLGGGAYPVNLPGRFALGGGSAGTACSVTDGGLRALCTIGEGRVTLLADAALLETGAGPDSLAAREAILERMLETSFGP